MTHESIEVGLSALHEQHFGVRTAIAHDVTAASLARVIDFCGANAVRLLIVRCSVENVRVAQSMEHCGFRLMDTLFRYARDLGTLPDPLTDPVASVRPVRGCEAEDVRRISAEAFRGYLGHYRADERLDPRKSDQVYERWAYQACLERDPARDVLVAVRDERVVGFGLVQLTSVEEGQVALVAVEPASRGLGVRRTLLLEELRWCADRGARRMVLSTQIHNFRTFSFWARLGFEPVRAEYTFHRWFDGG